MAASLQGGEGLGVVSGKQSLYFKKGCLNSYTTGFERDHLSSTYHAVGGYPQVVLTSQHLSQI